MRKLIIALGLGLIIAMFNTNTSNAQHFSVDINLGIQPAWGPSGYDYAAFYYFPDLNIYYDINEGLFIYPHGRRWVSSIYLPKKYRRYDLYSMYKVVINDVYDPWMYNQYDRRNYAHYCNNRSQMSIYYINDRHYYQAKHNHWAWVEPRYMPKQNDRDHRHLGYEHKQAQFDKNQYRSTANNAKNNPPRNSNQVTDNNRKRNEQATANRNREENRSSNIKNNDSRSSANNQNDVRKNDNRQMDKSNYRNDKRNEQTTANTNRTENKSSNVRSNESRSSANNQNEVRRNESQQVQKSESRNTRSNDQSVNNSRRSESKPSGSRSSERSSSVERRSENKENRQAQSTENKSRSSGRSGSSRLDWEFQ